MIKKKQKFVLIDGNALIHRAYHAIPPLTTKSGELVNSVFGFASILLKAIEEIKPTHMAVAFDMKGPTFRHKMYKEYKATRVKAPQELYDQMDRIKQLVEAFNIPIYEKQGFEADDIVGTLSKKIKINNVIVTGDLDELQLVDDNTEVYTMRRGMQDTVLYDEKKVVERFGIKPDQLIDYKGLRGDPSDNIPGVKGVGEKTASILLQKYGTIENLYKEIKKSEKIEGISDRIRKLLLDQEEQARMSKELATIIVDMDLEIDLKKCEMKDYDKDEVVDLLRELEFRSLLSRLPESILDGKQQSLLDDNNSEKKIEKIDLEKYNYTLVDSEEKFDNLVNNLEKIKEFAIDTETTSVKPVEASLVGVSFSIDNKSWYLPRKLIEKHENLKSKLEKILENKEIKKIAHNGKYDLIVLKNYGFNLNIDFDTMIAAHIITSNSRGNSLDNLAFQELGHQMMSYEDIVGKGRNKIKIEEVDLEKLAYYACEDADYTFKLKKVFEKKLKKLKKLKEVFENIEMPLVATLALMEIEGIKIDKDFFKKLSEEYDKKLRKLETNIYKQAGTSNFNINSTQQLSKILFEKLNISNKGIKKNTTGYSTAAQELEKLHGKHNIIPLIEEYREYNKLKNTYIDSIPKLINKKTNRVHTSFNQTITTTGRLSSSDPNLQNIPVRTEVGRKIRKGFIAEKGFELLSLDYSQIELRLVAQMSKDSNLTKAFKNNEDIHARTASLVFNKDIKDIDYDERRFAKTINFGVIYGMGSTALSRNLDISRKEAREFIEKYFKTFPSIKKYTEETLEFANENGYVKTQLGRRRYLPELNSKQPMLRAAAERMAVNMPLQGCLPYTTKILTLNGYIPIGKLYNFKKKPEKVWNGEKWVEYKVLNRGKAKLAEIEFKNGQILKCDVRHKVLCMNDEGYFWKKFKNLKIKDKVCFSFPNQYEFKKPVNFKFKYVAINSNPECRNLVINSLTPELWYWIGYYYGDGYMGKRDSYERYDLSYFFGQKEKKRAEECIRFFRNTLKLNPRLRTIIHKPKKKVSTRIVVTITSQGLGKFLEKLGVKSNGTAHTKRLPSCIFQETLKNRKALVKGIMDSDGTYGKNSRSVPNIHLCQRNLLSDIQLLLRTLGVESKLRGPYGPYNSKDNASFTLDMPRRSLMKLLNRPSASYTRSNDHPLPDFLKKEILKLYPNLTRKNLKTESDYIVYNRWKNKGGNSSIYHFKEWLERNKLKLKSSIYTWHEIKNIRRLNKEEITYTLSVINGDHKFDSEGIISKNTAADIIKMAMIEIVNDFGLRERNRYLKMILQVHDELVFEIKKDKLKEYAKKIQDIMENIYKLDIPLKVDMEVGDSWGEMSDFMS